MSKDIGIILKPEKVLAFLNGATQMRVPLRTQPPGWANEALMMVCNEQGLGVHFEGYKDGQLWWWPDDTAPHTVSPTHECSPFGVPGDVVWFKETFYVLGAEKVPMTELFRIEHPNLWKDSVIYRADGDQGVRSWRPAGHMPQAFSRIVRTVKRVWVEQINDISLEDCMAETGGKDCRSFTAFHILADICYPDARENNVWCWAGEFVDTKEGGE